MKKIIIVNNNMQVGGVQKSLYNLLWEIGEKYDVTLCLFKKSGKYADQLPPSVKVIEPKGLFRYLGISQGGCSGLDAVRRGALAAYCRMFGRNAVMKLLLAGEKTLPEHYDCAISYLHNGREKAFYGGVQDYVLHRIKADKKVAFLHCDYRNCGANHADNNRMMEKFDKIAACSDGCRRAFESVLPNLKEKCVTVRNCHRFDEIRSMAGEDTVRYDKSRYNVLTVSRLSHEKGVERAIEAVAYALQSGLPVTLHIVGDGAMRDELLALVREREIEEYVHFYGEQSNPYRYMKNANLFLLTSYHEAAPMVIEEAHSLGLPILTVETTSSEDMVTRQNCGWVCENTQDAINQTLMKILSDSDALQVLSNRLRHSSMDNSEAMRGFAALLEK